MIFNETKLKGCFVLEPTIFNDDRGYFYESYNKNKFNDGIRANVDFVQDNQSFSTKGVLRGLHFQSGEFAQAKLVRVLNGSVLDVAVDMRKSSQTFGQYFSIVLSSENKKLLFIPRGFAHGFAVLSNTADFFYKCDNYYNSSSEGGIIYNDQQLNIDWKISKDDMKLSSKDLELPTFKDALLC